MNEISKMLKIQYDDSYSMLKKILSACPDNFWKADNYGLPIWNQVMHTLMGSDYWLRTDYNSKYQCRFDVPENVYDILLADKWCTESDGFMTKTQVEECFKIFDTKKNHFFDMLTDEMLYRKIWDNYEFTYLSVVSAQIRHIMCHVGMCNAAIIAIGADDVEWIAFGEN